MKERILSLLLAVLLLAGVVSVCAERTSAVTNGVSEAAFSYLASACRRQGTPQGENRYVFAIKRLDLTSPWEFQFCYDASAPRITITMGLVDGSTPSAREKFIIDPNAPSVLTAVFQMSATDAHAQKRWVRMGETYITKSYQMYKGDHQNFDVYIPDVYYPSVVFDREQSLEFLNFNTQCCVWFVTLLQEYLEPGGYSWKDLAPETVPHQGKGVDGAFRDVTRSDYYFSPVLWCAVHDITVGTSETTFSPKKTCTRAEVVTFLWRAAGCPEPKTTATEFRDVDLGKWYGKAVLWAVEQGITNGVDKTHFAPNQGCTRGHVVTFLARAKQGVPTGSGSCSFTDVRPGAYYYDAVRWAVEQRITEGVSKTSFAPNDVCTRGQIVTFIMRAYADSSDLYEYDA